jgi:antirestriction protein ArdC
MAWKNVGRMVKKGEKAFHIVKPYSFQDKNDKEKIITGFGTQAEFGYEQTEGDPLPELLSIAECVWTNPDMIAVASSIGCTVETGFSGGEAGFYRPSTKHIQISSDDKNVLYHELAHAVDYHLRDSKDMGDSRIKEVVAEYSSAILSRVYNPDSKVEVAKSYIEGWSGHDLIKAMDETFHRVKLIVEFIMTRADNLMEEANV